MKIFLLIYFLLFFGLAMVLPTYRIWKTTGVNPYKLGSSDTTHDYIGKNFRLIMLALFIVVIVLTVFPKIYSFLLPISFLTNNIFTISGVVLLLIAMVWVLVAQTQMQKSWRIGIDEDVKTKLVQRGLFKISRNPIFLGMRIMLLGLFLIIPNAVTLVILISGELLIQIQVRLEEEFLVRTHDESYIAYKKQVRRWI